MVEKYKCPKCGIKKPFEMFGRRLMNGSTLARQSYCTKCRGLKSTRRKAKPDAPGVYIEPPIFKPGSVVVAPEVLDYHKHRLLYDKEEVLRVYDETYPNDSYSKRRSYKTKLKRLQRKGVL